MKYLQSREFTIDVNTFISCIDNDEYLLDVLFKKNGVFLDVGAFVGAAGVKAFLCGAKKVIYVEPNKDNCQTIRKFYETNNLSYDYSIIEKCAYSTNDGVYVNERYEEDYHYEDSRRNVMNVFTYKDGNILLPSTNLEGIFSSENLENINVLKIDCEGSEFDFLTDNKIFENVDVIVGEFHFFHKEGIKYDASYLMKNMSNYFIDITQTMKSKNLINEKHKELYCGLDNNFNIGLFVLLNKKFKDLDHYLSIDL